MRNHIMVVHEGKKSHRYNLYDYSGSLKQTMKQHISVVHEGKKPFECPGCDLRFFQNAKMKGHFSAIHESSKYESSFKRKARLANHISCVHDGNKQFKCNSYEASCALKAGLSKTQQWFMKKIYHENVLIVK